MYPALWSTLTCPFPDASWRDGKRPSTGRVGDWPRASDSHARPCSAAGEGTMNARSSLARSNTIVTPILTLALLAGGCAVDTSSPGDAPDDAVDPTEELGEVDSAV